MEGRGIPSGDCGRGDGLDVGRGRLADPLRVLRDDHLGRPLRGRRRGDAVLARCGLPRPGRHRASGPGRNIEGHTQAEYGQSPYVPGSKPDGSGLSLNIGGTPFFDHQGGISIGVDEAAYPLQGRLLDQRFHSGLSFSNNNVLSGSTLVALDLNNPIRDVIGSLTVPTSLSLADFPAATLTVTGNAASNRSPGPCTRGRPRADARANAGGAGRDRGSGAVAWIGRPLRRWMPGAEATSLHGEVCSVRAPRAGPLTSLRNSRACSRISAASASLATWATSYSIRFRFRRQVSKCPQRSAHVRRWRRRGSPPQGWSCARPRLVTRYPPQATAIFAVCKRRARRPWQTTDRPRAQKSTGILFIA